MLDLTFTCVFLFFHLLILVQAVRWWNARSTRNRESRRMQPARGMYALYALVWLLSWGVFIFTRDWSQPLLEQPFHPISSLALSLMIPLMQMRVMMTEVVYDAEQVMIHSMGRAPVTFSWTKVTGGQYFYVETMIRLYAGEKDYDIPSLMRGKKAFLAEMELRTPVSAQAL